MTAYVLCPCRHAVERHAATGCTGDRETRCACPFSARAALEAAVHAVRATYDDIHGGRERRREA